MCCHGLRRQRLSEVLFGPGQRIGRADMHPHAFKAHAVKSTSRNGAVPKRVDGKVTRLAAVEQPWMHDLHAWKGKWRESLFRYARKPAVRVHQKIARAFIADRVDERRDEQKSVHLVRVPPSHHAGKSAAVGFHPDRVCIVYKKRLASQHRKCLENSATAAEDAIALVRDMDFEIVPLCQMLF